MPPTPVKARALESPIVARRPSAVATTGTVQLIGVPMDLGASRRGVDMGPSAMRLANVSELLQRLGYHVADIVDEVAECVQEFADVGEAHRGGAHVDPTPTGAKVHGDADELNSAGGRDRRGATGDDRRLQGAGLHRCRWHGWKLPCLDVSNKLDECSKMLKFLTI